MTAETTESPFGEITLSAGIPGLPFSQMHVEVKPGISPFIAAKQFRDKFIEAFGAEAVAAAVDQSKGAQASAAPAQAAGGAPRCNLHNREMKQGKHGWFCPAKLGDGTYCKETA